MDLLAGGQQVLGDLAAGLTGAHHHGTVGQVLRVAVVVAVELVHIPGESGGRGRDARALEGTVRQDHVLCREETARGFHSEVTSRPGKPIGLRAQLHRRGNPLRCRGPASVIAGMASHRSRAGWSTLAPKVRSPSSAGQWKSRTMKAGHLD
jgi:hypothetical protein